MKKHTLRLGVLTFTAFLSAAVFADLAQDFEAAVKAGKPLSAEAAYVKLVKAGKAVSPRIHLQAAEVARALGKGTAYDDRTLLYLRLEKGWNADVERALWRLCSSGSDVDLFARLNGNTKADRALWSVGRDMLGRLAAANRPQELLKLADLMMSKFPQKNHLNSILNVLYDNCRNCGPNYPKAELAQVILRHAGLGACDSFWNLLSYGNQRDAFAPEFAANYVARNGGEIADDLLVRVLDALDYNNVDEEKDAAKAAARDARVTAAKKAEKTIFDGKHPQSARKYVWVAGGRLPKAFFPGWKKDEPAVGLKALYDRLTTSDLYKESENYRRDVQNMRNNLMSWKRFSAQECAALVDAEPASFPADWLGDYSSLGSVSKAVQDTKSTAPIAKLAQKYPKQADAIYRQYFSSYAAANDQKGDIAAVKRIFMDIAKQSSDFGYGPIDQVVSWCKGMSVADKLALFKSAYTVTGWSGTWKEFKNRAARANDKDPFYGNAEVKKFGAAMKEGDLPGDPLLKLFAQASRAKNAPDMAALVPEFKKLCPWKYNEGKTGRDNWIGNYFLNRYLEFARNAAEADCRKYTELAIEKLSKTGPETGWLENCLRKVKDANLWLSYYRARALAVGNHDPLAGYSVAKDSEKPADGIDMKKMTPYNASQYLRNNWGNVKSGPARDQLLLDYLASRPYAELNRDGLNWALATAQDYAMWRKEFAAKFPVDDALKQLLADKTAPAYPWDCYLNVLRLAYRAGKYDAAFQQYAAWADALEVQDRLDAYNRLLSNSILLLRENGKEAKDTYWDWFPGWYKLLTDKYAAALKAVPDVRAGVCTLGFDGNRLDTLKNRRAELAKSETNATQVAKIDAFYDTMTDKVLAGMRNPIGDGYETMAWHSRLRKAIQKKDAVGAAAIARRTGASIIWHWMGDGYLKQVLEDFKESGANEAFYLYVDAVSGDQPGWLVSLAAKYRAELASTLPGIYPVGENDPAYPLYVAADELSKKNPERAWQILQDPKNQTVFEREALKLPPDFVIWGVEQLRMDRGEKDKLLLKARQIATAILSQESKVSPEMAAAMVLSRAESYRDQQNFEAAKLEYQSLRDNPTYHATKYGKKAMFRAMDLQIASGNVQGTEATLEYWLSQNDREIQAQAHYFMALIAFDRKDFDECIKQLRQVFAINLTHTEGRFLHGQWKLATNSEVDDTDVLVGDLTERNMIRPGNQLTVTVQDSNLSVAGGGASIPVIVRTEPGKDEERINLYPTSRDPSNFKGLVEVQLGKACPSNRVLEVIGDDTVSYVIDPDFLKERGLPLNEPKRLRVIDDGKLAMGAGAPRTEEKKTEKGLKDLLDEDHSLEDTGVSKKLRPGNPLYVVVQDRDRSLGGEADSLRVSIETSSGDRLDDYELKEEKPYSGVFRGKIATSLPPPRAFAHDTAAGMNPGDVINKNKKGGWKSLSDGQPGKWFEVDTMGSYLFSEITLDTPSVEDVKSIRLVGRMGSKVMQLGRLPAATEMSKLYLRRQQQYDRNPHRSLANLRAFCQTDRASKRLIVEKIEHRALGNGNDWQTALYAGPFAAPAGVDSLRFRIQPTSSKKDALRSLWVTFALDGEEIFSGQGFKLQNALVTADLTPGCHQFELAVVSYNHNDDFNLVWEPIGKGPQAFPADWFNEEKHVALKKFVKDQAQIVKTANGFKAVFEKPVRLRSFRWEFADVKSPDVSISRISAKDDRGEDVLPVESDFSDSQSNKTLEVAPGDKITVKYEDERTTSGEKKVLQRQMDSSFNDAKVRFIFEDTDEKGNVTAWDAFRFQPGDSLVMAVIDPDCDITDEADKIEVSIKNAAGETFTKKLVEFQPKWGYGRTEDSYGMHSGIFMGVLKTCEAGNTNAPAKVMRVKSDDCLTVSYEDRENTDPGVPCSRSVRIFAARPSQPSLTLFDVRKTQEIDKSADAKVKLERIRRRPGNENVNVVYCDVLTAAPMDAKAVATTNPIPVNVSAGSIPVRVNDRSRARYACSKVMVEAVAHSEIAKAAAEGRDPDKVTVPLKLGGGLAPFRLTAGDQSPKEAQAAGTFNGLIQLSLGPIDPNIEIPEDAPPLLCVTGSDLIDITVLAEDGQPVMKRTLKLVSDASLGLSDSTFSAERNEAHVGESFFVKVDDADRDATDEPDKIDVLAISSKTGVKRPLTLTETMPHSGIFTGRLRPVMFAPGETIPSVATGGVASANEILTEDRFAVSYGDKVIFTYKDELTLPGTPVRTLSTTGTVFRGANGDVRLFSKRFTDRDTAVLVQFRLAECLFEQAKEHRKLKQPEKSAAAIDEGKFILEEALKNYPDSSHVVQGEFLLANLYQELATEAKDAEDMEKAIPLYQEALSRFSQILGTWPEGEYAARSQYHKALCLEMLKDYNRASEEYVKMTYLYPESDLVGEATIRLATYYYTKEKRYDISGHIYQNFQQRFPQHNKAARALFMAGSCYIKQAETIAADIEARKAKKEPIPQGYQQKIDDFYRDAVKTFDSLVETYRESESKLRAQTLYWAGDVSVRRHDYSKAYQYLKRTVFEFPETEWARRARGLLLQEGRAFKDFE